MLDFLGEEYGSIDTAELHDAFTAVTDLISAYGDLAGFRVWGLGFRAASSYPKL